MEPIRSLISGAKSLAQQAGDTKTELNNLKIQLICEEKNLNSLKMNQSALTRQIDMTSQLLDVSNNHLAQIKFIRDYLNRTYILYSYFLKYIQNQEPNEQQQMDKYSCLHGELTKLLRLYEDSPGYKQVLEEQAAEKDLLNKIAEKRNQLMKLDTEREFS